MSNSKGEEADSIYESGDYHKLYDFCKSAVAADPKSPELLWRFARAGKLLADETTDQNKKKEYIYEAFNNAKTGLEVDENHWALNKWYGILLDLTARFEGTKKRIENSYLVKKHLSKAIEQNPNDATTLHSLGVWCFEFADLPWYQKKIASALFATPPESSYEDALKYFSDAESKEPNFYCYNLIYLAKCYDRLKNPAKAKEILAQARDFPAKLPDDVKGKEEAAKMLAAMK